MTATANNESSFDGKPYIARGANVRNAHFPDVASTTKNIMLDPTKIYNVSAHTAGATDFTLKATKSTPKDIADGRAVWAAGGAFANKDGDINFGELAAGYTALQVTALQHAAASDTAGEVTILGSRCVVECMEVGAVASAIDVDVSTIAAVAAD